MSQLKGNLSIATNDHYWERLIQGDQTVLKVLYNQYATLLYNYGRYITQDATLVQDCIHDLFLDLWNQHQSLSSTTAVKPYLYKALRRKIVAEERKITRQLTAPVSTDEYIDTQYLYEFPEAEPSEDVNKVRLTQALTALPKRQREVLSLIFFENLTRPEAAEVMGIDTRTIYSLTCRAIKSLRQDLVVVNPAVLLSCLLALCYY
ncbi:RNA polymerase sigma factor [Tunicatimonas pelagia]|uniref:RNA polymerase sigma factor n=1 Tax=Tunicatimonas pelagia TaxID=931531 RepID=UPI0026668BCD|nr:sigma-70 family RNA polymerase sigma factor [Tunicatimonas pelagia]WKN44036.1 sigma-70 family RNA polymerase sigma factor [Tunicatimonas pelagia]